MRESQLDPVDVLTELAVKIADGKENISGLLIAYVDIDSGMPRIRWEHTGLDPTQINFIADIIKVDTMEQTRSLVNCDMVPKGYH
jgi:hypothetical protein